MSNRDLEYWLTSNDEAARQWRATASSREWARKLVRYRRSRRRGRRGRREIVSEMHDPQKARRAKKGDDHE